MEARVSAPAEPLSLKARDAVQGGVGAAHVIDAEVPGALLLEVFTSEGLGATLQRGAGADLMSDSQRYLSAN
jgi:acetylglutamate kinase